MNSKWLKRILGGLSFTAAIFVFEACYGTPQDMDADLYVEGTVKSESTGLPVPGIKVSLQNGEQYVLTDGEGAFSFYTWLSDSVKLRCDDVDSVQNGSYEAKETELNPVGDHVVVEIKLKEN